MKRSEVNAALVWAKQLLQKSCIHLPVFGYWTLQDWKRNRQRVQTICTVMLGWDITDYGTGNYERTGGVLFTIRNGKDRVGTPYAEKLILLREGQCIPLHYHACKTEDIINRSGGVLALRLYNRLANGAVDESSDVLVYTDGIPNTVKAGEIVEVLPGNSITLTPYLYHVFWAKEGAGDLVVGEVSSINDDKSDNYFAQPVARFAQIEEDEPILHPLCNEYDAILS